MIELLVVIFFIIHVTVHLKRVKMKFKTLYYESAIFLVTALLCLSLTGDPFYVLTGSWKYPIQPIDLLGIGICLGASTILLNFLTDYYRLNKGDLLAILPWSITCEYRFVHEFVWVFHYWISKNIWISLKDPCFKGFGEWIEWLDGTLIAPALLTHIYAILVILFFVFNIVVILCELRKRKQNV